MRARVSMDKKIQVAATYLRYCHNKGECWVSPTALGKKVGQQLGFGNDKHSSFGSPICKEMVARGLAKRNDKGHYCLVKS